MTTLTLCPPLPVEDARTRKPNRRKGSVPAPSNVIPLPTPDADAAATARHLARLGWTPPDALASGMGLDVWAAMLAREIGDEAGPSCPA